MTLFCVNLFQDKTMTSKFSKYSKDSNVLL